MERILEKDTKLNYTNSNKDYRQKIFLKLGGHHTSTSKAANSGGLVNNNYDYNLLPKIAHSGSRISNVNISDQ